jgi:hypothetical protein
MIGVLSSSPISSFAINTACLVSRVPAGSAIAFIGSFKLNVEHLSCVSKYIPLAPRTSIGYNQIPYLHWIPFSDL